jgi:hypothetical protein
VDALLGVVGVVGRAAPREVRCGVAGVFEEIGVRGQQR